MNPLNTQRGHSQCPVLLYLGKTDFCRLRESAGCQPHPPPEHHKKKRFLLFFVFNK